MFIVDQTFVSIRMIILKTVPETGEPIEGFADWMTGSGLFVGKGFLDAMGGLFKPGGGLTVQCPELDTASGLESIIFLKGNKHQEAVKSKDRPPWPGSTPAGANADYAWITLWTNQEANKKAWSCPDRPLEWYNNVPLGTEPDDRGLWNQFIDWCFPKGSRPPHGPAYDCLGVTGTDQVGRGAGCLVEGFVVLYNKGKDDWPDWP